MAAMLEVKDIHCGYDGAPVIRGLSLEVCEGEIVAILGANGAGKSTTMRTICGLMHPEKGQILFRGEDITRSPASVNIRKGISYIPEGRRLFPKLSVRENLELGAFTVTDRAVIEERLEEMFTIFPKLRDRSSQTAETLSGGEQQMCAIARGLMSGPKLIMLDELSLGLMPSLVEKVFETVDLINRQGITVLLVEQMVQEALDIANRGYVLQTGRVVHSGTARELLDSDEVKKAYMGM
ncbi:MAG: ABC transporter ATP-binding protein [Synergistaceae bacterium]|jgi:branched-chain amino acid transport system ATP-binding protein|uniref:ABC transporter ATP-binding protein n=2 Tax=Aminivibrio sp. TaxID=1872489 RepID=UPI002A1B6290|nr:ABC transporter ATP-binding protein [Synergistaceae bacterium]MDD3390652.1 ABC transporter ATP-binding protein [Synergistaceae bacterium]MDD3689375.1 ABC transporter ATP-binding protein [Synergistaceae bacterium]MDD4022144.1 ABC transporter ATP-binding protein [Synergistaceae bacterium]MDD4612306.1 ABC transporter ATP-binding protein [Synergistaceae bacterium]